MTTATKKVNINTVAKLAKVSTTTVSNYINATEVFPICDDTKGRISRVMRELNYRPHIGGSLIGRKRKALPEKVSFVFGANPEYPAFETIQLPLLSRLLRNLSTKLADDLGMILEVKYVKDEKNVQDWNDLLLDVDYVINFESFNSILYDMLQRKNIPILELSSSSIIRHYDPRLEPDEISNPVQVDELTIHADHINWSIRKQTTMLMDRIYDRGCRNILMVPSWNVKANRKEFYAMDAEERVQGFMSALKKHSDIEGEIINNPMPENYSMHYEMQNTYNTLMACPEKLKNVDAIVCHNDIIAQGVIAALNAVGIVPGKDVLVAGAGDFIEFEYSPIPILTSDFDQSKCINEICRMISRRKKDPGADYKSVEIPALVIERDGQR